MLARWSMQWARKPSQTEWGLTVKAWRVTITGNWKFKPKLASGGNWSCWREWRLTLRLSSDRQWAAITAFSNFYPEFSLLYIWELLNYWELLILHESCWFWCLKASSNPWYCISWLSGSFIWKHAHCTKQHLIARNVWKHLWHGNAAAAVGYKCSSGGESILSMV